MGHLDLASKTCPSKLSEHFNAVQRKAKALLDAHSTGGTKLPHAQRLLNFAVKLAVIESLTVSDSV